MAYTTKVGGETRGLAPSLLRRVHRLITRRIDPDEIAPAEFSRELWETAHEIGRRIGVLISRDGRVEEVFVGSKQILYVPDLGRYRLSGGRLRRLRLLFSDLSTKTDVPEIPADIFTDLEKLRLDAVVAVKAARGGMACRYAYLMPDGSSHEEVVRDMGRWRFSFRDFISDLERELTAALSMADTHARDDTRAMLVSVSDRSEHEVRASLDELQELCRTAGVQTVQRVVQRKKPDPRSVLGKGKLEEVVLTCLKLGAGILVFDTELKPSQWRVITNATDLKVLDRSMVILDIFAQRASSSEGRLQVELAQLTYNLPRLVEQDAGLSRLTGGIGGRGPGETKLEIGRRRARERITLLKERLEGVTAQRSLRRQRRTLSDIPLVAIIGYTNAGKSTLFNRLTGDSVLAEDKLFATLTPFQRRVLLSTDDGSESLMAVFSDTVGFIRELPHELLPAFRATLEEIEGAAVVLHVVDASDPELELRYRAVRDILRSFDLSGVEELVLLNKIDKSGAAKPEWMDAEVDSLPISALTGEGIAAVRDRLARHLSGWRREQAGATAHEQLSGTSSDEVPPPQSGSR